MIQSTIQPSAFSIYAWSVYVWSMSTQLHVCVCVFGLQTIASPIQQSGTWDPKTYFNRTNKRARYAGGITAIVLLTLLRRHNDQIKHMLHCVWVCAAFVDCYWFVCPMRNCFHDTNGWFSSAKWLAADRLDLIWKSYKAQMANCIQTPLISQVSGLRCTDKLLTIIIILFEPSNDMSFHYLPTRSQLRDAKYLNIYLELDILTNVFSFSLIFSHCR